MKALKFAPVPIMVGVLAFVFILLVQAIHVDAWPGFITWAGYLLAKPNGLPNALRKGIAFTLGILIGMLIVISATYLDSSFGSYALAFSVACAAFVILLLELVPFFDMAPAYFLGAATFFAAGAKITGDDFLKIWVPGLLGIIFGLVTAYLRTKLIDETSQKNPR